MNNFKNFSESGSKTIKAALNIAGKMGHITVGTEHLLMGVLSCGKTDAVDLLGRYDISFVCVYNVVLNVLGCGQMTKLGEDDFSTNALDVLKDAYAKSVQNGKGYAGINEILYALVSNSRCMAHQIIMTLVSSHQSFLQEVAQLCRRKNTADFSVGIKQKKEMKTIEKYSRNLTAQAKLAPFDPCIGRENEIRQLIEILLRRYKNNPCLVGLAGVGKTAIVEGLANMIIEGNVPPQMKSKSIYAVDMAWLLAGTKYRGDFEERVKSLIEEASGDRDVILFIDEIHTIVSAGGAEGAIDAANILKPALSRGLIQIIGATTRDEYARTIEKDGALERRFCPVEVQEPDINTAVDILKGLKEKYQEFHEIEIADEALSACINLSVKHIHNRFLPDKAVDLLDRSCAAAKVAGKESVSVQDVIQVLSRQKGISVYNDGKDNSCTQLENKLKEKIIGQPQAVTAVADSIKRWYAGLKKEENPIATFLFCGSTGTGKTYTCKVLSDAMFPQRNALVRIDCSEYGEKNNISKLIGSPPGYVGYDEGGRLEKEISAHNGCVVLFDEIEKAHSDLHNLLLQAMDNGFITTGRGKKISFRNCVIAMTTNAAASLSFNNSPLGFEKTAVSDSTWDKLHTELKKYFSREFLGRINEVLYFEKLDKTAVWQIIEHRLYSLTELLSQKGILLQTDSSAKEYIYRHSNCDMYGAREINSVISRTIETKISDMILSGSLEKGVCALLCSIKDEIEIKILQTI